MKRKKLLLVTFLTLCVVTVNPWTYQILLDNFFLGAVLLLVSLALSVYYFGASRMFGIISLIVLVILSLFYLFTRFDKDLMTLTGQELNSRNLRQGYYWSELGKIYQNKLGVFYFNKVRLFENRVNENLFISLDFKLPVLLMLLFFVGFFVIVYKVDAILIIYFTVALVVSSLLNLSSIGASLFYPFVCLCVVLAIDWIIQSISNIRILKSLNGIWSR